MVDFKDIPELIPSISSEDVPGVPIKSPVKRPPIVRALSKVLAVQPQDEVADVSDPDDDEDMAGNDPSKGESTIIANRYILTDPPASPLRPLLIPGQRAKEYSSNLLDASPFIETSRDITKYRMEIRHVVNKHNHLVKRFNHELKIQNELRDKLKQAYEIVCDNILHIMSLLVQRGNQRENANTAYYRV